MTEIIDGVHFRDLAEKAPKDVCERALCRYDEKAGCYRLIVWGDEYAVYPRACKIERITADVDASHEYFNLFVIHYLLQTKNLEPGSDWISEKDIPGGQTFFRGPHEIPGRLMTKRYGNDINAFADRCRQLGGRPVDMGDAAYRFTIAPRIPVVVLYWKGDEDFPPEAGILYDRTIIRHLALDVVFALAVEICVRIGGGST